MHYLVQYFLTLNCTPFLISTQANGNIIYSIKKQITLNIYSNTKKLIIYQLLYILLPKNFESLISCWCPSKLPKELSWILSGLMLQSMASLNLSRKPYHLLHQRNENCWSRHHHWPSSLSSGCSNNIPQTRKPKPQTFISPSSRGLKSEIKALTDLGSGDSPCPSLQMTFFLLCPHRAEREQAWVSLFFEGLHSHDLI